MVESIAYGTDRLLAATSPEQQRLLAARLRDMERATADMAARAPELGRRIAPARQAMREGVALAADSARQARLMRLDMNRRSRTATGEARASLAAGRAAAAAFDERIAATRPAIQGFSESVAASGGRIAQAREGVAAVKDQLQQLESGSGSLISGPPTPDYKPKSRR
jgi:hypothetical protein